MTAMPQAINRLALFDIDGTLMITRGMTSRCIEQTGQRLFDPAFKMGPITPGRLDHQLFADIAENNGITLTDESLNQWKASYFAALETELKSRPDDIIVLPGVRDLWERAHRETGLAVGLLTGNFRKASHLKLDAAGIDYSALDVQVHGGDAEDRVGLVHFAMKQMRSLGIDLDPLKVTIIGDTPRDIACARGAGCRCMAVATGRYRVEQLAEHRPDTLVRDLTETDKVAQALELGEQP